MDCLARAFAQATHTNYKQLVKDIGHDAPYHIQEIIDVLGSRFSITELTCSDIDPDCPFGPERIKTWMQKFSGVIAYWTSSNAMHAVAWNHKNGVVYDNGEYKTADEIYTLFWIVAPRNFLG